jgi:DNA repair exonuclease SbcCD ATPase subunit
MNITELRNKLERFKGQKAQVQKSLQETKEVLTAKEDELDLTIQAREILKQVGLKTQEQLQYHIGDITSLALGAIFEDDPYELKVSFVQRRNKTECDLLFVRNDNEIRPIDSSGGGAVDVASFALRVASWSMKHPKTRNTIILDEPMRFLSEDRQEQASKIIKEISQKLGIQFIIITHEPNLAIHADKIFEVKIRKGVSKLNNK